MGIKKNIFYSSILTTSNYIFPLIVYPYVSRTLEVTNIGICNFVDSIINYFILFSMMGISIMGNRMIATARAKKESLDSSFSSLMTINGLTTILALTALIFFTFFLSSLRPYKELLFYGCIKLISNFFLIEWFYKGLENFKFITIRTIIVKILFIISVFIFVREKNNYPVYYLLTVLMISGNSIINTLYSRRFVNFKLKLVSLKKVMKPYFMLGVYLIVTSLCTTFNVVYLGFATNDTQVGYYTTAIKLYSILLALFSGVTSVLLPRMSGLMANNKMDEFKSLMKKTTNLLFIFSIPIIFLSVIFAPQIIFLISGPGYEGAIIPMRIVMSLMLIIGLEQIAVVQCLMPLHKDKVILFNSSLGAVVSIAINLTIVRNMASIGSSIAWLASEFVILILSAYAIYRFLKIKFPYKKLIENIIYNIPLATGLCIIYLLSDMQYYWLYLIFAGIFTVVYTMILQIYILKNDLILSFIDSIASKVISKNSKHGSESNKNWT